MKINFETNKFKDIVSGLTVGFIGNFVTSKVLANHCKVIELSVNNPIETILNNKLSTVIIESEIYEEDHEWYMSSFEPLISKSSTDGVQFLTLSTNISEHKEDIDIFIDFSLSELKVKNETLFLPIILDEGDLNPSYSSSEQEILLFQYGECTLSDEMKRFLKNYDVQKANPTYLSRKVIKTLLDVFKKTDILYFIDNGIDPFLSKIIELAASLQNALVIVKTEDSSNYKHSKILESDEHTINFVRFIKNNKDYINKLKVRNHRNVMIQHSMLLNQKPTPEIGVMLVSMREERLEQIFKDLAKQSRVSLQIVLLTHGFKLSEQKKSQLSALGDFELLVITKDLSTTLGECLNECLDYIDKDFVIKMDDDDFYYSNFILDLYIAINYSKAEIVGKYGFYFYLNALNLIGKRRTDKQYINVTEVKGNGILCKTKVLKRYRFSDLRRHEDSDLFERVRKENGKIYCIHPYDMCVYRDGNKSNHSYQVDDANFLRDAETVYFGKPNETISSE